MSPQEPTPEECSANAPVTHEGRPGFATWYPQMGGYVGKCVVLFGASIDQNGKDAGCFDAFVWHDGEFPFDTSDGPPVEVHHCGAEQFIRFGQAVLARVPEAGAK